MMTDTTRFCRVSLNLFLTIAIVSLAIAGCTDSSPGRTTSTSAGLQELPTFNRDIAPIIFNNCTGCHRPGEIAPFELVTYKDVHKRAKQIAMVTASRYMPPWLPVSEPGHFMGQRSLSDREIATIKKWVKSGAPEGDPADLPLQPKFKEGWQLGEPDMIVTMPEPYVLAAEGTDVFRNFVIPVPIQSRHMSEQWNFDRTTSR